MKIDRLDADDTGPLPSALETGYESSRFNAMKHGALSRFTVLPWEDGSEYQALLEALIDEHTPLGPTEQHLVEEMAGAIWRKRRLRLAEAATYKRGLHATIDKYAKTAAAALVLSGPVPHNLEVAKCLAVEQGRTTQELDDLDVDERMTAAANEILKDDAPNAFENALAALHASTRESWEQQLSWELGDYEDGAVPFEATAAHLLRWLEVEIGDRYEQRRAELHAQPVVRIQALGEALNPDSLERLGRYEVHLDRKLERMLSMLLRLQDLRRARTAAAQH